LTPVPAENKNFASGARPVFASGARPAAKPHVLTLISIENDQKI